MAAPARPDLHPVAAPRRGPWRRLRVVRAGDRHPHQEHPPQARARSARAAPRPDRLRRRLPVRGRAPVTRRRGRRRRTAAPARGGGDGAERPAAGGPAERGLADRRGGRGPWRPWPRRATAWWPRGFGCLFGLVFLLGVAGARRRLVGQRRRRGRAASADPSPGCSASSVVVAVILAIAGTGRTFRRVGVVARRARRRGGSRRGRRLHGARRRAARRRRGRCATSPAASTRWPTRLEADEAQRRTLLADVSHELRTPLAVVQGNVEAILDGVHQADEAHLGAILEETRVLAPARRRPPDGRPLGERQPAAPSRADRPRGRRHGRRRRRSGRRRARRAST